MSMLKRQLMPIAKCALSVTLGLSLVPAASLTAFAEEASDESATNFAGGDGTENNPYLIAETDQLVFLSEQLASKGSGYEAAHYCLVNDIDISQITNWTPLGSVDTFCGTFDGNGHKISGLSITEESDTTLPALFGMAGGSGCVIRNLVVSGNISTESTHAFRRPAGVVSMTSGGELTIENVTNQVDIQSNIGAGGILGTAYNKTVKITHCVNEGDFSTLTDGITQSNNVTWGGIVGYFYGSKAAGSIDQCHNDGTISDSSSAGTADGKYVGVGGVVGAVENGTGVSITSCYNSRQLQLPESGYASGTQTYGVGGIVGYSKKTCTIDNCFSTKPGVSNNSTVAGDNAGMLFGYGCTLIEGNGNPQPNEIPEDNNYLNGVTADYLNVGHSGVWATGTDSPVLAWEADAAQHSQDPELKVCDSDGETVFKQTVAGSETAKLTVCKYGKGECSIEVLGDASPSNTSSGNDVIGCTLADDGTITITPNKQGSATLKVSLSSAETYKAATTYVYIEVVKREPTITVSPLVWNAYEEHGEGLYLDVSYSGDATLTAEISENEPGIIESVEYADGKLLVKPTDKRGEATVRFTAAETDNFKALDATVTLKAVGKTPELEKSAFEVSLLLLGTKEIETGYKGNTSLTKDIQVGGEKGDSARVTFNHADGTLKVEALNVSDSPESYTLTIPGGDYYEDAVITVNVAAVAYPETTVISSAGELAAFSDAVNRGCDYEGQTVQLADDIDLGGTEWKQIGVDQNHPFKGVFDGLYHKISFGDNENSATLFGFLNGATLRNYTVSGAFNVGRVYGGTADNPVVLENIGASFDASGYYGIAGGIVDTISSGAYVVIESCYNKGNLTCLNSTWDEVEGVASDTNYNYGCGGIVGTCEYNSNVTVRNCYNAGNIDGYNYVGGIVGGVVYGSGNGGSLTIESCYNTGSIKYKKTSIRGSQEGDAGYGTIFGGRYIGGTNGAEITIKNCASKEDCVDVWGSLDYENYAWGGSSSKTADLIAAGMYTVCGEDDPSSTLSFLKQNSTAFAISSEINDGWPCLTWEVPVPVTPPSGSGGSTAPHEHVYGEGVVTKEATCTEPGEMTYTCTANDGATKTEVIPALGHTFGEWVVTTPATEEAEGVETHTCSVCGESETRVIDKLKPTTPGSSVECTDADGNVVDVIINDNKAGTTSDGIEYAGTVTFSGSEATGKVVVPETVEINGKTYVVTEIAKSAFEGKLEVTSVAIPKTVVKIGSRAFANTGITSAAVSAGIEYGTGVFRDCKKLTKVTIGKGVKVIKAYTFKGCTALKTVTIAAGVTKIERSVFSGCTSLGSVTIPSTVKSIGKYVFYKAKTKTITIKSKNLTKKSVKNALKGSNVTTVKVPASKVSAYKKIFTKANCGKKVKVVKA